MKNTFANLRGILAFQLACFLVFFSGCVSGPPQSGFLSDYSQLELHRDDAKFLDVIDASGAARSRGKLRVWDHSASLEELSRYHSAIVDPFVVRLGESSPGKWVSPEQLSEITESMHAIFVEELSHCYTIVDEPADATVHFRFALTDILPIMTYESPEDIGALQWANSKAGGYSFEVEMLDSVSNKQLAAMVGQARGGDFDPMKTGKDPWDNAREGISGFGKFLCERHTRAHAKD
ncbi:MAG: DUF3313 domain-containing protein [Planctomycetota bacterium]|jgi:hypothetical protein